MSTAPAAVVALIVLAAAGALPTLALAGLRWVAVPLAPLAGAVIAALSAAACLAIGGPILGWFVAIAVAAAGIVGYWCRRSAVRPRRRSADPARSDPGADPARSDPGINRVASAAGAVVVLAATAWSLVPLRAPSIGFDARTIWMLHAVWFVDGHRVALAALRNPALPFAHASYPPLVGGAVAVGWLVTGDRGYLLGVVIVALLNACAVASAAWVAIEVGRRCGARVAGVVVAGLFVLVAFGVAGPFATDGYADLLWAAAAVGAVGFGLVLPGRGHDLGAAVLLLVVAGLTKNEGTATAMAIVVLMAARSARGAWLHGRVGWQRPLAAGAAGVLALGGWPVLMKLLDAAPNVEIIGSRQGDDVSRAHQAYDAMAAHLHVLLLALPVALVGALLLRRARRATGVGNDGWAWVALAAGALAVAMTYVTGAGNVEFWLVTSVNRTTFFPALAAWWIVGIWAVVGMADNDVLDDGLKPVLHHHL